MLFSRSHTLLAISGLLVLSLGDSADAQIVRRFAGGGVQINAPFVRVNVGPGGATSVRAPFTAVNSPGRVFVGRRRRMMAQSQYSAPQQRPTSRQPQPTEKQPEVADVDQLSYPTSAQLAEMNDKELVETLRQMMARLHYRLSRLQTGEGWQDYLVLSREVLGSPGASPESAQFGAIREILPRYQSVQDDPQFTKISALPSFIATFAALQEADRRSGNFQPAGPSITDPNNGKKAVPAESPNEGPLEILPTPQPTAVVPDATRGEHSILKRK